MDSNYVIDGAKHEAPPANEGLSIVPTPLGHLKDITIRALETLAGADLILCEDTRVTRKLLTRYCVNTPLQSYHEHNAERIRPKVLEKLAKGMSIALVSDAGTPLISDPGFKLVSALIEADIPVTGLPGPSAPVLALTLSGLPSDRFLFAGFTPSKSAARRKVLESMKDCPASLIFFESAKRLSRSLADMAEILGPREAVIARELTKLYEELRRAPLDELARHYGDSGSPKGEIVIVTAPPGAVSAISLDEALNAVLSTMSLKDAAHEAAKLANVSRHAAYERALELSGRK